MKIAIIGANGRSGQVFVKAALTAGHEVRGGFHRQSNLAAHPKLTIVKCDATKEADLKKLITDCDAVVSLIGHVNGSPPDVQTRAIQNTIRVMKRLRIKRLVSLTGTGVRLAGDKITLADRILNFGVRLIDPARVDDGINHVEVLANTDLDWTVVRVLKLQNVPPRPYRLHEHGPTKLYVGREEVARAILEVLEDRSFLKKAPIISQS